MPSQFRFVTGVRQVTRVVSRWQTALSFYRKSDFACEVTKKKRAQMLTRALRKLGYEVAITPINPVTATHALQVQVLVMVAYKDGRFVCRDCGRTVRPRAPNTGAGAVPAWGSCVRTTSEEWNTHNGTIFSQNSPNVLLMRSMCLLGGHHDAVPAARAG